MEKYITYIVVFFVSFISTYICFQSFFESPQKSENQEELDNKSNLPVIYQWSYWFLKHFSDTLGTILERQLPDNILQKIKHLLKAADVKMSIRMFLTSQAVFGILLFLIFFFIGIFYLKSCLLGLFIGVLLGFLGMLYPLSDFKEKAKIRQESIIRALPFAIDLIVSAMKSGKDLLSAIKDYVTYNAGDTPLVKVFNKVILDLEYNRTTQQAFREMCDSVQMDSFTTFGNTIIHSLDSGASIIDTLKSQGSTLRRERFALARVQAEKAKLYIDLSMLFLLMPAFVLVIGFPIYCKVKEIFP